MSPRQTPQANGRAGLAVYESYREGRRTRQRTVRSLGFVDELAATHEDPIGWARSVVAEMNARKAGQGQSAGLEAHPCGSWTRGPRTGVTSAARSMPPPGQGRPCATTRGEGRTTST